MDCAACGEPAYCTEQEDGDWVCAGCLEKEENNEEWDEMLIDDALTTD